jgi:hypothetical protein
MDGKWVTRGGAVLRIEDMSDAHVVNAVKRLRKEGGFLPKATLDFYLAPDSAMAEAVAERGAKTLAELEAEALKRGLDLE